MVIVGGGLAAGSLMGVLGLLLVRCWITCMGQWHHNRNVFLNHSCKSAAVVVPMLAENEDGDKGGKREYCQRLGIEYLVLRRTPAPGLPKRSSTDLRSF